MIIYCRTRRHTSSTCSIRIKNTDVNLLKSNLRLLLCDATRVLKVLRNIDKLVKRSFCSRFVAGMNLLKYQLHSPDVQVKEAGNPLNLNLTYGLVNVSSYSRRQ